LILLLPTANWEQRNLFRRNRNKSTDGLRWTHWLRSATVGSTLPRVWHGLPCNMQLIDVGTAEWC
jgi:hypothetical protein